MKLMSAVAFLCKQKRYERQIDSALHEDLKEQKTCQTRAKGKMLVVA